MILYKVEPSGRIEYKLEVVEHLMGGFFICQWIIRHGRPSDEKRLGRLSDFEEWDIE